MKLKANPSTTVIQQVDESTGEVVEIRWIGRAPTYGPDTDNPGQLCIEIPVRQETKIIGLQSIDSELPTTLEATTAPNGHKLVSRPTMERDVVGSVTVASKIPLPILVIEDLVAEEPSIRSIELEALADDDGFVSTLMLVAGDYVYLRYSNTWIPLTDPSVIDGLDVFSVEDAALDLYDQYDRVGRSIHVGSLPMRDVEDKIRSDAKVAVVATARELKSDAEKLLVEDAVPVLATASAVLDFIPTAVEHASMRWYVEKRAVALGMNLNELPWRATS